GGGHEDEAEHHGEEAGPAGPDLRFLHGCPPYRSAWVLGIPKSGSARGRRSHRASGPYEPCWHPVNSWGQKLTRGSGAMPRRARIARPGRRPRSSCRLRARSALRELHARLVATSPAEDRLDVGERVVVRQVGPPEPVVAVEPVARPAQVAR